MWRGGRTFESTAGWNTPTRDRGEDTLVINIILISLQHADMCVCDGKSADKVIDWLRKEGGRESAGTS